MVLGEQPPARILMGGKLGRHPHLAEGIATVKGPRDLQFTLIGRSMPTCEALGRKNASRTSGSVQSEAISIPTRRCGKRPSPPLHPIPIVGKILCDFPAYGKTGAVRRESIFS